MVRVVLGVVAATLLVAGTAWADDQMWDWEDTDVSLEPEPVAEEPEWTPSASGPHYFPSDVDLGAFLMATEEHTLFPSSVFTREGFPHADAGYPEGTSAYGYENVYGPMWGVPEDAVGLDDYVGYPYFYTDIEGGVAAYEYADGTGDDADYDENMDHDINRYRYDHDYFYD